MKINYKKLSVWIVPIGLSFLFDLFFSDFRWFNIQNLIENIIFLFSIGLFLSCFKKSNLKALLGKICYSIFILSLLIETCLFYLFDTFFSASSIFIFFETNPAEVKEFLFSYIDISLLLYVVCMFGFIGVSWFQGMITFFEFDKRFKISYNIIAIVLLVLALKLSGFIITNTPFQILKGSLEYAIEIKKYSDLELNQALGHFQDVQFKGSSDPHIFVLIIGESTTRRQMGLYGYERETTPLLSKRKDNLWIYNDVISSESHTIESLQDALVFKDDESQTESSVIQLMNQAGFKTFWLSNQRPIGIYETLLTKLSKASDHYKYTNTTIWGSVTPFDEVLLPHLDKALNDEATHKFIVVNLLATHASYDLRYPKAFDNFKSQPSTRFPSESNFKVINHYHNAITYVDYLINTIIEKVKSENDKSYVLFFSDHGEEVFYDKDFVGHNDSDSPTRSMFEIPFFLWTSDEFDGAYGFDYNENRPYVLDDFIHSLSDLSQVKFSRFNEKHSIFSEAFKPKPRIVGQGINFDTFFKD